LKKFKQNVQVGRTIKKESCESEGCHCSLTYQEPRPSHVHTEGHNIKFD